MHNGNAVKSISTYTVFENTDIKKLKEKARDDIGRDRLSKIMKKFIKILSLTLVALLMVTGFCACTPVEENIDTPELKYDTLYPQTKAEYNQAMNSHMVSYFNYLETHISSGQNLLNGTYVVENEIKAAKNSLASMEDTYQRVSRIYPPTDMASTHASILLQMKEAINSMSVYIEYLEKSDGTLSDPTLRADVEATINIMKSEYTSLTGVFNIHR